MNQAMPDENTSLLKHFMPYKVKSGEDYMSPDQRDHFKQILHAWKQDLMEEVEPLIIDQLRASMREKEIELNDKVTVREMMSYIVTESGAMQAESGCFDDCVMSLAIANHVHQGAWEPVESSDNYYIEMV